MIYFLYILLGFFSLVIFVYTAPSFLNDKTLVYIVYFYRGILLPINLMLGVFFTVGTLLGLIPYLILNFPMIFYKKLIVTNNK